jgi:excisionase family DNA binding protein
MRYNVQTANERSELMLSVIALIAGLVLMIKGDFRVGKRYIPKNIGRVIALLLISPITISFCVTALVLPNAIQNIEDVSLDALLSEPAYQDLIVRLSTIELGALVIALLIVGYLILSRPEAPNAPPPGSMTYNPPPAHNTPSDLYPFAGVPVQAPPPAPSVMTVEEAATYLRVAPDAVQRLIDEGKIAAARTASGFRIAKRVLDDYLSGE